MRNLLALAALIPACIQAEDDPPRPSDDLPACASPMLRSIYDATFGLMIRGTVPVADYATFHNHAEPVALIDGPEIFPAFRALIASAEHEVVLQTYVWEPDTDPSTEILAGLTDLADRRAREAPDAPPVIVRFLFDASTLGFGSRVDAMPAAWASVEALGLDPRRVQFELAGFYHAAFGNLHVKTVVVDGREAIVTGANPQAHHDYAAPWRDSGYRLAGDVARALRGDFASAWQRGEQWTCGGTIGDACRAPTAELPALPEAPATYAEACLPMLVVTRAADANPISDRTDNTQDQALLAGFAAATDHIRMHTPNLNDNAAVAALLAAAERGVQVDVVLSKGFNDDTEIAPGQGGTNDTTVATMYQALADAGLERARACDRLRIRWYSRDGAAPVVGNGIYASHAKYTSIDDAVVVVGTANMDTQSWNNSREVNVLVDDRATTTAWDEQLFEPDFEGGIRVDACAP